MVSGSLRGTQASSTTKAGHHDIDEILLKVPLNATNQIKSTKNKNRRNEANSILLANIYMTGYSPGLMMILQQKVAGLLEDHTLIVN
jgi:hypothetical protein